MSALSHSVPVKLEDTWAGLVENSGLLRLDGETLVLEFEAKDSVLDVLRSDAKRHALSLSEVESCRWVPGWFGGRIEISTRSLSTLSGIPGATQGRLTLKVARKDRDCALDLVTSVELVLAHRVVKSAEAALSPPRSHNPP